MCFASGTLEARRSSGVRSAITGLLRGSPSGANHPRTGQSRHAVGTISHEPKTRRLPAQRMPSSSARTSNLRPTGEYLPLSQLELGRTYAEMRYAVPSPMARHRVVHLRICVPQRATYPQSSSAAALGDRRKAGSDRLAASSRSRSDRRRDHRAPSLRLRDVRVHWSPRALVQRPGARGMVSARCTLHALGARP